MVMFGVIVMLSLQLGWSYFPVVSSTSVDSFSLVLRDTVPIEIQTRGTRLNRFCVNDGFIYMVDFLEPKISVYNARTHVRGDDIDLPLGTPGSGRYSHWSIHPHAQLMTQFVLDKPLGSANSNTSYIWWVGHKLVNGEDITHGIWKELDNAHVEFYISRYTGHILVMEQRNSDVVFTVNEQSSLYEEPKVIHTIRLHGSEYKHYDILEVLEMPDWSVILLTRPFVGSRSHNLVKYNTNGQKLASIRLVGERGRQDLFMSMTVDPLGNIYVNRADKLFVVNSELTQSKVLMDWSTHGQFLMTGVYYYAYTEPSGAFNESLYVASYQDSENNKEEFTVKAYNVIQF